MLKALRGERGNVLLTATLMTVGMMMLGLAAASVVDNQTGQSRKERERESTFNHVEGTLAAQTFVLGRLGTGTADRPFPNVCNANSTAPLCPSAGELAKSFNSTGQADFISGADWETSVRDNQDPSEISSQFYHPSLTASNCAASTTDHIWCHDQNGDDQLWVRASSTVKGKTRTLVALIRVEKRTITFPNYAVLAGSFTTSNNGNKVIVDATGSLGIAVRCHTDDPPSPTNPCLGYDPAKGQLSPPGSYADDASDDTAIPEDDLFALEDAARGAGTYYDTCPVNPAGAIVYVKSGDCLYSGTGDVNSLANPGVFIIENGTLTMQRDFYGIVYAANRQNSSGMIVSTQGNGVIYGGVLIDGPGSVLAGSSKFNVVFKPEAFTNTSAAGTAGVVQNTWRELPAE